MRVWRNVADDRRERPVLRADGTWGLESWHRHSGGGFAESTWSGNGWPTEAAAIEHIMSFLEFSNGLTPVEVEVGHITEGWPEREQWQAPEGSVEIEVGQVWRKGSRHAAVIGYGPNHAGILSVRTRYTESLNTGGRRAMKLRTPAAAEYGEQRFRKLFKFVSGPPVAGDRTIEVKP